MLLGSEIFRSLDRVTAVIARGDERDPVARRGEHRGVRRVGHRGFREHGTARIQELEPHRPRLTSDDPRAVRPGEHAGGRVTGQHVQLPQRGGVPGDDLALDTGGEDPRAVGAHREA